MRTLIYSRKPKNWAISSKKGFLHLGKKANIAFRSYEIIDAAIAKQCSDLGCKVIAIGGTVNHVHLLTDYPPNLNLFLSI
ncbi:transposase [Nostoc sp. FACHB-152]|uniref:transposase n=1 Tax=Nostoc sp. FACHB-152 TaxID=2692837 RepID=UPI001F559300|nr:transposase [Nostoc sp. FACHB-152]